MKNITIIIFLIIGLRGVSQENYNPESFNVSRGDIESKTFQKDSTANALVIYEEGNSYVDKHDYDLRTDEKYKIKILSTEGFDNASITLYLYNSGRRSEKVKDIVATTYNLINGEVVKTHLDEKNIFREDYNENYTLVKFTLPNIQVGCVITYSYTFITPFMFKYKEWNFQSKIPKLYSEYRTSIPGNWLYNIKLVGGQKLSTNTNEIKKNCLEMYNGASADCGIGVYAMTDIPAFVEEDYMTAESNYLARIEYELKTFKGMDGSVSHYTKSWETVDHELKTDPNIGKQLGKSVDLDDLLPESIIDEKDALKKAKSIYQFVQENYTWNNENKIFKDVSVKDLIKNKSGNVASINILLHNLLEESGIEVKPILLSTRNNGFPTKIYPVISDFNYLIVQTTINNNTYLLDATDNYLNFGDIPFRCLNEYGRLLDFKNGSKWVDLIPASKSSVLYNVELSFDENQNLKGVVKNRKTGYHALNSKKAYFPNINTYLDNLENKSAFIEIYNHQLTSNIESDHFSELYDIEYNQEDTAENLYLNPFVIKFFTENPFKLQERTYPIDFGYQDNYLYIMSLDIGNDYIVEEKPEDIIIALPNNTGSVAFSTKVIGNKVNLTFKIDFKESIYPPEFYPYLKEFMSKIVDIQKNTLIVLKRT
ncbi:DUF3857 domain-containing protein [Sabulilitoribacter multivorans]|uniref:DUF3857 domain-containing protein n=1 Tax=Flaviramulus multivorans TaxID=1304750 RepID=A0ABS9II09_9FLAO|nr:DUF3857 domain-containing protein [Flaviramulus multivorans]MCF7560208.1 DUF3857 domain-containing protein [Flaviramulus multivorans]